MGITGKGRCNLTNSAPIMDFISKTPGNGKFLYSAYEKFNNEDLLSLFHSWGLATKVERGGRVFPKSDDAQEVRHLFMKLLHRERWNFIWKNRYAISCRRTALPAAW